MNPLKVLVVDDSLIAQKKLIAILKGMGHEIVGTARTGSKAIEAYGEHKPDIVTMDITMPDMDGIEATRHILKDNPEALIVMVTSHGQEQMIMSALDAGAKGYVLKPVKEDSVEEMFTQVIENYS
ncbi:response regulator [Terasakiella sp. SH-1]|uniref:response regulator n=1 Tax=Terasakiella sp. SH-1 TaxID=2560057 RepID=UPI0010744E12|nr:response regulator [Terasakiella sp. SH-1]